MRTAEAGRLTSWMLVLFGQKLRPCVNREFSVSSYRFGVRAGFDEPIFVNPAFFAENRAKESRGFYVFCRISWFVPSNEITVGFSSTMVSMWTGRPQMRCRFASVSRA